VRRLLEPHRELAVREARERPECVAPAQERDEGRALPRPRRGQQLDLKLAAGGGVAVRLRPTTKGE